MHPLSNSTTFRNSATVFGISGCWPSWNGFGGGDFGAAAFLLSTENLSMYEEHLSDPLNPDFSTVFAKNLAVIAKTCPTAEAAPIDPQHVLFYRDECIQRHLTKICRSLLLPGSRLIGSDRLVELARLAAAGHACIACFNHQSNLDVPTLDALLEDQSLGDLSRQMMWIAGRKLHEDNPTTRTLVRAVNRVIVSPRSWLKDDHTGEQLRESHLINMAAQRVIHQLRHDGWIFALFPTGTRFRPRDQSTAQAIGETDSYLKRFEFMLLGRINGCTLPVSLDHDFTHEIPRPDRVTFTFGQVLRTDHWRAEAARKYLELDQRAASARAIMEDILKITEPS